MQTTQNDILSFDASIKGGVKKQSKSSQKGGKEDGEFLSMVLDAAAKKGENLSEKDLKEMAKAVNLSAQTAQNQQAKAPVQSTDVKEILGEEAAENLFENATFMQLLQILEMLSGGEKISKFPNFENRLAKALSNETILNELIEIANKLNLGLENIEVTQVQADELGEKFPSLAKKDFVVIDGAPQTADLAISAIKVSNFILIPVQPSPYDIWATSDLVDLVKQRIEITDGKLKAAFVINRAIKGTKIGAEIRKALEEYDLPVLESVIFQRVSYPSSASMGKTVTELEPSSDGAKEIISLTNEILTFLEN